MAMANKTKNVGIENEAKDSKNSPFKSFILVLQLTLSYYLPVAEDRFQEVKRKLQWGSQEVSTVSCRLEARVATSTWNIFFQFQWWEIHIQ